MSHPIARIWKAGYHDLVSVVPPDAPISPQSSLRPEARGKVPGMKRSEDGFWTGYNFLRAPTPTGREVARWVNEGANIGMLAGRFPCLDIDCDSAPVANLIQQEALKFLGPAPVRTSRPPRKMLVYRTDEPFGRMSAKITVGSNEHVVEVLGAGRQYVIYGAHPSGTTYGWETPLWDFAPEDLAEISPERVRAFFTHLSNLLENRATVTFSGDGALSEEKAPPQESLRAPSIEALEGLVASIPNTFEDRDDYILVGHAIKAAGGEAAFPIFQEWCERWEGGENDPATVKADWDRMRAPFRVGWAYLASMEGAEAAAIEFPVDEDAEPEPESPVQPLEGTFNFSDTWVVTEVARMIVDRIRFVPETGQWHVWNGHVWAVDRRNLAEHIIRKSLVRLSAVVADRAAALADKEREAAQRAAFALQQRAALTKSIPELQAHPALTLCVEDFDRDDWVLNTPGGIVDLRTGNIEPPDPAALCSKSTAVAPSLEPPERWKEFLNTVTDGDAEMERYLQKLVGYSLTGSTQEQILAFVHGPPLTGKSVFLETIGSLFGSYHETTSADTFAKGPSGRHPADIAALAGARLVTASETTEGQGWDGSRVKTLTGGDEVSARLMRQDFFTYRPRYQIIIVGNHEPNVDGADDAILRRLHIVPFENSPESPDRLLFEKLKAEHGGILSWALEGTRMWLEEGLEPPEAVRARTDEYKAEEDPVGAFLDDCCVLAPGETVSRRELFLVWSRWCRARGEDPGTLKTLRRRFRAKQRKLGWSDIRVRDEDGGYRNGYSGLGIRPSHNTIMDGEFNG